MNYFAGDLTGTREAYEDEQQTYLSSKDRYTFDEETMGAVHVPHFDTLLSGLDIHVLALFGEKDTNLNWRRTKALYESTIGENPHATLSVRTFPNANHLISLTETGSVREVEGQLIRSGEKAAGYYDIQVDWLRRRLSR